MTLTIFRWIIVCLLLTLNVDAVRCQSISPEIWNSIDLESNHQKALFTLDSISSSVKMSPSDQIIYLQKAAKRAFYLNQYDRSSALGYEGLKASRVLKNDSAEAYFYMILGNTNYYLKRFDDAIQRYDSCIAISDKNGYWKMAAMTMSNKGAALLDNLKLDLGESVLKASIDIMRQHGAQSEPNCILTHRLLATSYARNNKEDLALKLFRSVMKQAAAIGDTNIFASSTLFYSELLTRSNKTDSALFYAEQGLELTRKSQQNTDIIAALLFYSNACRAQGKLELAYNSMKEVYALQKDIFQEDLDDKVSEVQVKYETEKAVQDKTLAETKAKLSDQKASNLMLAIGALLLLFSSGFILYYLRNQRIKSKLEKDLQKQQISALIEGEEHERSRIARDLHDGVSQVLFALKIKLQASQSIDQSLEQLAVKALKDIRDISHNLTPAELSETGLVDALRHIINQINEGKSLKVEFNTNSDSLALNPASQANLYRIIQEVINNTIKHSKASQLRLSIEQSQDLVQLSVEDNGIGMTKEQIQNKSGIGWRNINARLDILNGNVQIDSNINQGTRFVFQIPIAA